MNLSDATAVYIGAQAASAVYITDADGTATKVWPTTAPSDYPATGTWGPLAPGFSYAELDTHTITESGTFTITHTVTRTATGSGKLEAIIEQPGGRLASGPRTSPVSEATWSGHLDAGAVILFKAWALSATCIGEWSIVKA
ncbi:hypothetical protein [Dietzia sp. 179-F 9C3 NHS]|uniref:hypothetical protein n=1 Tax=Dietzia sp. 179-F 9C3 NHS TaxID=3374295 RepID=UPI003879B689